MSSDFNATSFCYTAFYNIFVINKKKLETSAVKMSGGKGLTKIHWNVNKKIWKTLYSYIVCPKEMWVSLEGFVGLFWQLLTQKKCLMCPDLVSPGKPSLVRPQKLSIANSGKY